MKKRRFSKVIISVLLLFAMMMPVFTNYAAAVNPDNTYTMYFVPNSHIDTAWMWPFQHTADTVINTTYTRAINNLKLGKGYKFTTSASKHYEWAKEFYPNLYADIKILFEQGLWGIAGGQIVEPDLNMAGGEALVRQSLYGQHFFIEEFGRACEVGFVPDVFGFSGQFPQILKKSEMDSFFATKFNWHMETFNWNGVNSNHGGAFDPGPFYEANTNRRTRESDIFWWEAIDGSDVLAYNTYMDYSGTWGVGDLSGTGSETAFNRNRRTWSGTYQGVQYNFDYDSGLKIALGLFGGGDHGGGPQDTTTNNNYGSVARYNTEIGPNGPQSIMATIEDYFRDVRDPAKAGADLSKVYRHRGENYLAYHRGTYTSWSHVKKYNRQNEILAETAEKAATLAFWAKALDNNSSGKIDTAWDRILINQMHDVLPGSGAPYVYMQTFMNQELAKNLLTNTQNNAILALAHRANTNVDEGVPVFVYNPLSWSRTGETTTTLKFDKRYDNVRVYDGTAEIPANVISFSSDGVAKVSFVAKNVPSLGFKVFKAVGTDAPSAFASDVKYTETESSIIVENNHLQFTIDKASGNISSMKDFNDGGREAFYTADCLANELQYMNDNQGNYGTSGYPAWDVTFPLVGDPRLSPIRVTQAQSVEVVETSKEKVTIAVVQNFASSKTTRYITLLADSNSVDVKMELDWQEYKQILKIAFPVAADARGVSYEIAYGALDGAKEVAREKATPGTPESLGAYGRSTLRDTNWNANRYEQPGHKWMDITSDSKSHGVSIINDAKYGYDVLRFSKDGAVHGTGNSPTLADNESYVRARLSVVRSTASPSWSGLSAAEQQKYRPQNTIIDQDYQEFNYSIYPHKGTWQEAETSNKGAEFCYPFQSFQAAASAGDGILGSAHTFMATDKRNVQIGAVKNHHDSQTDENTIIVRLWESNGVDTPVTLTLPSEVLSAKEVNMLEHVDPRFNKTLTPAGNKLSFTIGHYEILTLEIKLKAYDGAKVAFNPQSISLAGLYDLNGISADSNRRGGNIDGAGNSVPAEHWPKGPVDYQGIKFNLAPYVGDEYPAYQYVTAKGQVIPVTVSGQFNRLFLLGVSAGAGDKSGTFTVNYTDGSSAVKEIEFADWKSPLTGWVPTVSRGYSYNSWGRHDNPFVYDSVAHVFTHWHNGLTDEMTVDNYLFVYAIDLDSSKTISNIRLPNAPGIKLAAITVADNPIPGFASVYEEDIATTDDFHWAFWDTQPKPIVENIAADTLNVTGTGSRSVVINGEFRNFESTNSVTSNSAAADPVTNLTNQNTGNKFCTSTSPTFPTLVILRYNAPIIAKAYYITGANDDGSYGRAPSQWTIYGTNDATETVSNFNAANWTQLDYQNNNFVSANYEQRAFTLANTTAYQYYAIRVTGRQSASGFPQTQSTASGQIQFSCLGFCESFTETGFSGTVNYLFPQVASSVRANWAGTRNTANGANVLLINGNIAGSGSTLVPAKCYTTIRDGLNIQVHPDTKFSYMFAPEGRQTSASNNNVDYDYHGAHMAIDLKFSDGTRLRDLGAIDQYGIGMHPKAQGQGKVHKTYQWNYVECELGKFAAGKTITEIIVGFEMGTLFLPAAAVPETAIPGLATPGHKVAGCFDDIKIFRDDRDYMKIDPADLVDIRHGANASTNATGAVIPSVARPNPFQYFVPTTTGRNDANKYAWTNTSMHGITTSKLASRHMGERLTFLFMANATTTEYTTTNVNNAVNTSNANFTHDNEFAIYNYHYGVKFNDNDARAPGVKLEVTPTTYGAVFRFTFPAGAAARNVVFAAPHSTTANYSRMTATSETDYSFAGWCQNGADTNNNTSGNGSLRRYFLYGEFDVQPTFYVPATSSINTLASFPDLGNGPGGSTVVEMRLTTSFLNAAQAKKNLGMDIVGIDKDDDTSTWTVADGKWFDAIKAEAKAEWNALLGSARINDPTANYWQLSNFYSKLARSNLYPTLLSEYTGKGAQGGWQYSSPYRGTNADPIAIDGHFIYNEGWWDTFKSKWPLIGLLRPEASAALTDGIVQHYIDQNGLGTSGGAATAAMSNAHAVPRWINPGGNNMMTGTSSDAVTCDMFTTYDVDFANVYRGYQSWTKSAAVVTPNTTNGGRTGLHEGIFQGYHPWGTSAAAGGGGQLDTTWSLEGYINDSAQVHMLKKMAAEIGDGDTLDGFSGSYWKQRWLEEAKYYESRAKNYVNHFDPQQPANYTGGSTGTHSFTAGWFLNRNRDGTFRRQNPLNWGGGYTEDNAWPYRVLVPQDGRGLANLLGSAMNLPGPEALRIALDEGFNAIGSAMDYVSGSSSGATGGYGGWIHEGTEKREVKLGQFGLSNQPSYHMPWMYLHSDQPWQAQYWTRVAIPRAYSGESIGYGYMGEEDNGAYASWYVWAAIGLYPLDLGSGQLVISSPTFRNISITNDRGKKITINAPNNSFENLYIQSMKVNGEDYHKLYLEANLLKEDLVIDYVMGPEPNKTWFTEAPPSLTKGDEMPRILKDQTFEGIPLFSAAIPDNQNSPAVVVTNAALTGNNSAIYLFDNMSTNTTNNSSQNMVKNTYDVNFTARTASITYFDPQAPKVAMYTLTSSNTANRDPSAWTLSASNDGENWVEIDRRAGEVFNWRRYTRPFAVSDAKQANYLYYKLDITDASGTGNLILAQIEFLAYDADWCVKPSVSRTGDAITVNANIINNTVTADNVVVYAALYSSEGKMLDVRISEPINVAAYSTKALSPAISLDASRADDKSYVKVFLWTPEYLVKAVAITYKY